MELFKLMGSIAIDNTKANQSIDETTDKAKKSEVSTSDAFGKIGGAAKKVAVGIGAAGAALGGAFIGAVEGTREYRTALGKLDTAFTTNGHSSKDATNTYKALQSVLGDTDVSVEAANHLAVLTDNSKDLNTWTDICTGVFATFGDSLPIEGLTEAANETAKVGQVTGPLADALNWAGISEDDFNKKLEKCSSEQERQKLIMKTLNKTYKDASDTYKTTNKDVIDANAAQERLTSTMAKLGEVGEPIMTIIKNAIASMAEKAIPVIEDLGIKIQDLIKWFQENGEKVKFWAGLIGIAAATAAGFVLVLTWSAIMTKAAKAIEIVTVAVKALNVAMRANLVGLIVTAILGLVAAFIYLWNNCEGFRNFWIALWDIICNAALAAWDWIKGAWAGIGEWFSKNFDKVQKAGKEAMDGVKKWFSDAWTSIKNAWSTTTAFFSGIWQGIKNAFSAVGSWFGNIFQGAWNAAKSAWNGTKAFFQGIWNGIKSVFSTVVTYYKNQFQKAWNGVKTVWNAAKGFFQNIWNGIKNVFSSVGTWFSGKFKTAWNNIKTAFNAAKSFFTTVWGWMKKPFEVAGTWFRGTFQKAWTAIKGVFSGWGSFFSGLWSSIKSKFGSIGSSIGTSMGNAVRSGMNGVIGAVQNTINKGIGLINKAISLANKLPGINVGKVPTLTLPRLAKGGVLEKGQVGILEGSGAEAVVPLERNRAWIANVAKEMDEVQKTKHPVDDRVTIQLNKVIELLGNLLDVKVYLDSGALVGELAPAIDMRMGKTYTNMSRGNTR